jgi:hypothetical protein
MYLDKFKVTKPSLKTHVKIFVMLSKSDKVP